jgi:hypothetical protein
MTIATHNGWTNYETSGPTLEDLYGDETLGDDGEVAMEYDRRRAAKVAEIAEYVRDHVKNPDIAEDIAEDWMSHAEDIGDIYGNDVHGEIPSRYTISGSPIAVTI